MNVLNDNFFAKRSVMKDLLELRDEIDRIDRQITRLYQERMGITAEVA